MTEDPTDPRPADDAGEVAAPAAAAAPLAAADEGAVPAPSLAAVPEAVGATLRAARERLGLSQQDVAARLRLHPRQVAALEDERYDALPTAPYLRGFLRNYARELRVDPAPLLAALAQRLPPQTPMVDAPAGGARVLPSPMPRAGGERVSRRTVIGGSLFLLVLLAAIGWMTSIRMQRAQTAPPVVVPAVEPSPTPEPEVPAQVAPPADASVPAPVPTPAPTATPVPAPAAAEADRAGSAAASGVLRLSVGALPSWIEVVQADTGKVLLTGLMEPQTRRQLGELQPPLRLVIGNARSVTLEYRGRTIDLAPHTRSDGLARLTLP